MIQFLAYLAPRRRSVNDLTHATKYGSLVYCLESNDHPADVSLRDVAHSLTQSLDSVEFRASRLSVPTCSPALALRRPALQPRQLYREATAQLPHAIRIKLVPYYVWGNRGDPEMSVWRRALAQLSISPSFSFSPPDSSSSHPIL